MIVNKYIGYLVIFLPVSALGSGEISHRYAQFLPPIGGEAGGLLRDVASAAFLGAGFSEVSLRAATSIACKKVSVGPLVAGLGLATVGICTLKKGAPDNVGTAAAKIAALTAGVAVNQYFHRFGRGTPLSNCIDKMFDKLKSTAESVFSRCQQSRPLVNDVAVSGTTCCVPFGNQFWRKYSAQNGAPQRAADPNFVTLLIEEPYKENSLLDKENHWELLHCILNHQTIFVSYNTWNTFLKKYKESCALAKEEGVRGSHRTAIVTKWGVCELTTKWDRYLMNNSRQRRFKYPFIPTGMDICKDGGPYQVYKDYNKLNPKLKVSGVDCEKCDSDLYLRYKKAIYESLNTESYKKLREVLIFNPEDWHIYDTRLGSVCLIHRHSSNHGKSFLRTNNFQSLTALGKILPIIPRYSGLEKLLWETFGEARAIDDEWLRSPERLFYEKQMAGKSLYFTGHGTADKTVCDMPEAMFAKMLEKIAPWRLDAVAVLSCYTPAERILNMLNKRPAPFTIITPISQKTIAWTSIAELNFLKHIPELISLVKNLPVSTPHIQEIVQKYQESWGAFAAEKQRISIIPVGHTEPLRTRLHEKD